MSEGWADWLWKQLIAHYQGPLILLEWFYPFVFIVPIVERLLRRQISQDGFDRRRFNSFVRLLTLILFLGLESPFVTLYFEFSPQFAVKCLGILAISILIWRFPEQRPYLSVFPEPVIEQIVVRTGKVRKHLIRRRKGYPVQLARGDQLRGAAARLRIGIQGDVFRCHMCLKQKSYPDEYGGTIVTKGHRNHACIDCIESLPALRREDLRRWL
jgi:hypothetical protein